MKEYLNRNFLCMPVYDLEPIEEKNVSEGDGISGLVDRKSLADSETIPTPEATTETAKENSYEKILERAQVQTQTQGQVLTPTLVLSDDAQDVVSVEEESRIQKLVNIALEKGPEQAFRVAVELDDMYALDMLHDKLSQQLYDELVSKGFLKEE